MTGGAPVGLFGEPTGARERAELLDEGPDVLAGPCTGTPFRYAGRRYQAGPVTFTPAADPAGRRPEVQSPRG
jgi:hypothetical protein